MKERASWNRHQTRNWKLCKLCNLGSPQAQTSPRSFASQYQGMQRIGAGNSQSSCMMFAECYPLVIGRKAEWLQGSKGWKNLKNLQLEFPVCKSVTSRVTKFKKKQNAGRCSVRLHRAYGLDTKWSRGCKRIRLSFPSKVSFNDNIDNHPHRGKSWGKRKRERE